MNLFSGFGTVTDAMSGQSLTGRELAARAVVGAAELQHLGAGPGRVVVLFHGGTPRFFADLLAVWAAGAAAAVIDPASSTTEVETIAGFVKAVAIVADRAGGAQIASCPVISLGDGVSSPLQPVTSSIDDPALILFTSGTTGEPKGVVHTFRSILARTALNRAYMGDGDLAKTMCVLPSYFGHGLIGNCLTPLFAGKHLILASGNNIQFFSKISELIDRHGVTFMSSVPAFWNLALRSSPQPRNGSLRRIHVGSAMLPAKLWNSVIEWSGIRQVVNMYGMTETANWFGGCSAVDTEPADGLVGRPWGGRAAVMRPDGSIMLTGEGEVLVQTPAIMQGYFGRQKLTDEVLRDGWLHTGDAGRIDDSGVVTLQGRIRSQINRAGLKVYPEDIDVLLARHPQVREACAFGLPDPVSGEIVAVAVVLAEGSNIDVATLRAWTAERIAPDKVPSRWFIVSQIPRNDRGKTNRSAVADACLGKSQSA